MAGFEQSLNREMAAVDRGGQPFCMVRFIPQGDVERSFDGISNELRPRMRAADIAGLLTTDNMGVILRCTGEEGAFAMANGVLSKLGAKGYEVNFKVYHYPGGNNPRDGSPPPEPEEDGLRRQRSSKEDLDQSGQLPSTNDVAAVQTSRVLPTNDNLMKLEDLSSLRTDIGHSSALDCRSLSLQPISLRKRALDVAVASTVLIALSPLFALVALAIRLDTEGDVLYAQKRAGQGAREFNFYKFRSMVKGAEGMQEELESQNKVEGGIAFKVPDDPRVTAVGRLLRRTCIDELPQFYNVLIGDMTLVGPRPPLMSEVEQYKPWQLARLDMRGGLTCIWQVYGRPKNVSFDDWMRLDLKYKKARSWTLDLWLLLRTPLAILQCRGAH